jgi:hypothetical protein
MRNYSAGQEKPNVAILGTTHNLAPIPSIPSSPFPGMRVTLS